MKIQSWFQKKYACEKLRPSCWLTKVWQLSFGLVVKKSGLCPGGKTPICTFTHIKIEIDCPVLGYTPLSSSSVTLWSECDTSTDASVWAAGAQFLARISLETPQPQCCGRIMFDSICISLQFADWCMNYGKHGCRTPDTPFSLFEGNVISSASHIIMILFTDRRRPLGDIVMLILTSTFCYTTLPP